jgi:hypothetical protein
MVTPEGVKRTSMAKNTIPQSFPSVFVLSTDAFLGADQHGAEIPLVINTAVLIGTDRTALIGSQEEYEAARGALTELSAARKAALGGAMEYCYTVRDTLTFYLGRHFTNAWIAAGWLDTLEVPRSYDGIYTLCFKLTGYFGANPSQENAALGVTAAAAQAHVVALQSANHNYLNGETASFLRKDTRDETFRAMRKRLSGLCKELSMRLEDLDPRWRWFGFNLPGAPTVPAVPEGVAVFALPGARLQISCDPAAGATRYRFYAQRLIVDPVPVALGTADEPLFISEALVPGQEYRVYVSASNEGAESQLSAPVNVTAVAAAAA